MARVTVRDSLAFVLAVATLFVLLGTSPAHAASITGTVTDSSTSEPLEGICVNVVDPGDEWISAGSGFTDEDGNYAALVASGAYKVQFFDCGPGRYLTQWWNDKPNFGSAEIVDVTDGDQENVNAVLAEGKRIAGQVTSDGATGIQNICVVVSPGDEEGFVTFAGTDQDGNYAAVVPADEYKVEFSDCGPSPQYLTEWWDGKPDFDSADIVDVTGGDQENVNAELVEGMQIAGQVTSDGVTGIEEICVDIYDKTDDENQIGFDFTDQDGNYAAVVPAGEYKAEFSDCNPSPVYLAEWWDDKPDFDSADIVDVTSSDQENVNAVLVPPAPVNEAAPQLSGTPAVGQVLSCSEGSWENDPTAFAYAWLRGGTPIDSQTTNSYTLQAADEGHGISCKVTATNAGGSASATSATVQVPVSPPPSDPASPLSTPPPGGGTGVASRVVSVKGGRALVRISCRGGSPCKGVAKLVVREKRKGKPARNVVIGTARFSIASGKAATLSVKLSGKGKAMLRKAGKQGLKAKLIGTGIKSRAVVLKKG
jgi:hypothetical protein